MKKQRKGQTKAARAGAKAAARAETTPEAAPPAPSQLWRYALAAVSGGLVRLGCPEYDAWYLAPVALVPLLASLDGLTPRRGFQVAFFTGFVWSFWGFFWITSLLVKFAGMSILAATPLALLFGAYHGASFGLLGAGVAYLRDRTGWPLWLLAPPLFACIEATWPSIFPFYLGVIVSAQPLLAQTAELGAVTLVGALIFVLNAALYEAVRARRAGLAVRRHALVAAGVVLFVLAYGGVRMAQVDTQVAAAKSLRVGVVQGNMSITEIYDKRQRLKILRKQQRVSAQLEADGAQLVVWGETSVPNGKVLSRSSGREPTGDWHIRTGFSVPAIVGANTRDRAASPWSWNTAVLVDEHGISGLYDKVFLLMFGEYVPLVSPTWFMKYVQGAAHLNAGEGPVVFETDGVRLLPLICYEGILPRFVRQGADLGIHFFANLVNDAWFGKTPESAQHMALASFRAIEHRKAMVRAVNTGISAYIDPNGRVSHRTVLTDPDVDGATQAVGFNVDVPLMDPAYRSPYALTGELFPVLCALLLGFALLRSRRSQGLAGGASQRPSGDP